MNLTFTHHSKVMASTMVDASVARIAILNSLLPDQEPPCPRGERLGAGGSILDRLDVQVRVAFPPIFRRAVVLFDLLVYLVGVCFVVGKGSIEAVF